MSYTEVEKDKELWNRQEWNWKQNFEEYIKLRKMGKNKVRFDIILQSVRMAKRRETE